MHAQMMIKQKDHYPIHSAEFYKLRTVIMNAQIMMQCKDHYMPHSAEIY